MGTYTFRWTGPAQEVYLTGNFEHWGKGLKLEHNGSVFEKTVTLPPTEEKILYKFLVDGQWNYDSTRPTELDHEGNTNNVLFPHDLHPLEAGSSFISSVAPGSSTLDKAGAQPLVAAEKDTPGAFPVTPAAESEQTFSVNPIPQTEGVGNPISLAPGEKVPDPSTLTSHTLDSTVQHEPENASSTGQREQTFGVAPLPATGGIGNPISLAAGEKVPEPSTVTDHTLTSNVTLDRESYDNPSALPPTFSSNDAAIIASSSGDAELGAILLGGLGPQTTNMIPESSMGMGNAASLEPSVMLSSSGPGSTTADLAGQVPLEPRGVPTVVSESQQEAHVEPEASANSEAVLDKKQVEEELQKTVPEAPVTSDETHKEESNAKTEGIAGAIAGGAAAVTAAAVGAAAVARERTTEATGKDPVSLLPKSVQDKVAESDSKSTATPAAATTTASVAPAQQTQQDIVPPEVVESQKLAHVSAEASANPEAVHEKQLVEDELKSKVAKVETVGEPAPTVTAATSATAPSESHSSGAPQLAPVAGVAPITIDTPGLNSTADSPAVPPTSKAEPAIPAAATTSTTTQPAVTTGVESSTVPAQSTPRPTTEDPSKRRSFLMGSPSSGKSGEKGEKRKGLFTRIKEKLKSHK